MLLGHRRLTQPVRTWYNIYTEISLEVYMSYDIDVEDSKGSLRCCACDQSFHPVWYEEENHFEELCPRCLAISFDLLEEDDDGLEDTPFG